MSNRIHEEPLVGCYIFTHIPSGYYYIGSSGNLSRRENRHRSHLRRNTHPNVELQMIFNSTGLQEDMLFECFLTSSREGAYAYEQSLINRHWGDPLLVNQSQNAAGAPLHNSLKQGALDRMWAAIAKLRTVEARNFAAERTRTQWLNEGYRDGHTGANHYNSRAVVAAGVRYDYMRAAARALGVSSPTIIDRCRDDRYPDYYYVD